MKRCCGDPPAMLMPGAFVCVPQSSCVASVRETSLLGVTQLSGTFWLFLQLFLCPCRGLGPSRCSPAPRCAVCPASLVPSIPAWAGGKWRRGFSGSVSWSPGWLRASRAAGHHPHPPTEPRTSHEQGNAARCSGLPLRLMCGARQEGGKASPPPPRIRCSNVPKHFISCMVHTTSVPTVLRAVFAGLFI